MIIYVVIIYKHEPHFKSYICVINRNKMQHKGINLIEKFTNFSKQWSPHIIARMNNYHIKIARIQGEFVWHSHPDTDEFFMVISGKMDIHFRDGKVSLQEGELFVVPKGVEHKPEAMEECKIMLIEPAGTVNTGNSTGDRTVIDPKWI